MSDMEKSGGEKGKKCSVQENVFFAKMLEGCNRMLERLAPPDDHLQEAGPSRCSFARGFSLPLIFCKKPVPPNDHLQEAGPSR